MVRILVSNRIELSKWVGPIGPGQESSKNEGLGQPNFSPISTRAF